MSVAVGVVLLAGCGQEEVSPGGDGGPVAGPVADVVVETAESGASGTWTLRCDPDGGDHPDVAGACAALTADGVLDPPPTDEMCTEIYGGPETAQITGTVDGARVEVSLSRSNGCEIARWDALAAVVAPGGSGAA